MNWKHTYLRKATEQEIEEFGNQPICQEDCMIWGGELPCEDSQILVYKNGYFTIDDWVNDLGECGLTENYDFTDFYWCELEAPDTGKGYGMNDELGVLLLELPEPRVYKYNYIGFSNSKQDGGFKMLYCQTIRQLVNDVFVHKCTRKEAENFPQFKWVPMSELEVK